MNKDKIDVYDIDRENDGLKIIKDFRICEHIFNSRIKFEWARDSYEQTVYGWDLTLENDLNIDIKSQVGLYEDNKYYDKLVLSLRRFQNGKWKDCLLSKKTDVWLFPVQIDNRTVEFYYIDRINAKLLQDNYPTYRAKRGGKMQEYMVIEFNSDFVKKAKIFLDLQTKNIFRFPHCSEFHEIKEKLL